MFISLSIYIYVCVRAQLYLSCLLGKLPTYLLNLLTHLFDCLLTYLITYLLACLLFTYLLTQSPTCLLAYLITYLFICVLTYLLSYLLTYSITHLLACLLNCLCQHTPWGLRTGVPQLRSIVKNNSIFSGGGALEEKTQKVGG